MTAQNFYRILSQVKGMRWELRFVSRPAFTARPSHRLAVRDQSSDSSFFSLAFQPLRWPDSSVFPTRASAARAKVCAGT